MVVQKHISIYKQPINIWINEHYIRSSHYITASITLYQKFTLHNS